MNHQGPYGPSYLPSDPTNDQRSQRVGGISYTCDEAIAVKSNTLNDYNAVLDRAIARGDTESIVLYKQLIKQTRVDIFDLYRMKNSQQTQATDPKTNGNPIFKPPIHKN